MVIQIQNMAKSVVYQKLLERKVDLEGSIENRSGKLEVFLGKEEIEQAIQEAEGKARAKRQIGFVLEE